MDSKYENRSQAGKILAERLKAFADNPNVIVLALPRGGVPVAYEVASALHVPLDVWVVRKLGVPGHEELAMGATAPGGIRVLNHDVLRALRISRATTDEVTRREQQEIERREHIYRSDRPGLRIKGKIILLIDDGLATGATMRVAVRSLRQLHPARIVVAVPTAAPSTSDEIRADADDVVCPMTPGTFGAVGLWYEEFPQVTDGEVIDLLLRASFGRSPD